MRCLFCGAGPLHAATWYVAPNGIDTASGAIDAPWRSAARAQAAAQPGDTVYFRGGLYAFTQATSSCANRRATVSAIVFDKSGSEGKPIRYWAYPGEHPVFDFSRMVDDCRVKGVEVAADWLHLKGLEVTGAPQQPQNRLNHESWGVWVKGSHNVFELLDLHHNMGPGLFIKDGAWNLVLNSDSHHNYDPYTSNGAGQSADGFGAHVGPNQPGNVFRGCRAWANTDDGFDLINAYSPVTIESSWAWGHGYLPGTAHAAGGGQRQRHQGRRLRRQVRGRRREAHGAQLGRLRQQGGRLLRQPPPAGARLLQQHRLRQWRRVQHARHRGGRLARLPRYTAPQPGPGQRAEAAGGGRGQRLQQLGPGPRRAGGGCPGADGGRLGRAAPGGRLAAGGAARAPACGSALIAFFI